MHAYSIFTIKLEGKDEDIRAATKFAEEVLGEDYEAEHGLIDVDECYEVVWLWDIEEFAARTANKFPELGFTMEGVVDTSESAGELMDFIIKYQDGKLTSQSSGWYLEVYSDGHLDDFLSRCKSELTEEDKENFRNGNQPLFVLESGDGDIVTKVPLSEPEEISLDDIDKDDDDDFDEDDFDDDDEGDLEDDEDVVESDEDDAGDESAEAVVEEAAVREVAMDESAVEVPETETEEIITENTIEEVPVETDPVEETAAEAEVVAAETAVEENVVEEPLTEDTEAAAEEISTEDIHGEETVVEEQTAESLEVETVAEEAPTEAKAEAKPEKIGFFRRLFSKRRNKSEKSKRK